MKFIAKAVSALAQTGVEARPIPPDYIRSLEVAVQASLPKEYALLLQKFGPITIPGEPIVELYDPAVICAYVASIYNMEGVPPYKWAALPVGRHGKSGDDLGYLRQGTRFGSGPVLLNHEGPWGLASNDWYVPLSDSLTAFIVERLGVPQ